MDYRQSFTLLKERFKEDEESVEEYEFYEIIDSIEREESYLLDKLEAHPKYNYVPNPEIPDSMKLAALESLKEEIETFVKNMSDSLDGVMDMMYPDHEEDDIDISNFFGD